MELARNADIDPVPLRVLSSLFSASMTVQGRAELSGTPYDLVRELGRGGMGIVFEAVDRQRGDVCAVKLIRKDANPAADLVDRLRLEAETLAKVRSPHFVGFRGAAFTRDGSPYYAMEKLVGRTLKDELLRRPALSLEEVLVIGIQVLDGLAAAHAIGVVHRDIKPENIFLCDGEEPRLVRLLDLGVAKVVEPHRDGPAPRALPTATGLMVGSLRWAAPEVIRCEDVDARTDIYSAGLVLFAMASGDSPFSHATSKETLIVAQCREPLPKLASLRPHEDLGVLDAIIAGATVKERTGRTRTARDVSVELRHHLRERFGVDLPPIAGTDRPRLVSAAKERSVSTPLAEAMPTGPRNIVFPILRPGDRFAERYDIVAHLGQGGMGTVYRARHSFLGREIALKLIPLDARVAGTDFGQQFAREMQVLAKVDDPNVVKIFDGGVSADGIAYIVMELLPGQSLRESLRGERALDDARTHSVLRQVANGLAALHAVPILHRDIKPENIIVLPDGSAKIVDFGLARVRTKSKYATAHPNAVGTLHYMPREQLMNEPLDESVDVYAFGLVLYECFTGTHARATLSGAFQNRAEAIRSVVEGWPLEPIERRRPDLSPEVVRLFQRCVDQDPQLRPKSEEVASFFTELTLPTAATELAGDPTMVTTAPPFSDRTLPRAPHRLAATVRDDAPLPLPGAPKLAATMRDDRALPLPRPKRVAWPFVFLAVVLAAGLAVAVEIARPGTFLSNRAAPQSSEHAASTAKPTPPKPVPTTPAPPAEVSATAPPIATSSPAPVAPPPPAFQPAPPVANHPTAAPPRDPGSFR